MSAGTERVTVSGPAGSIEAAVDGAPGGAGRFAVVCHPHPLFGGTMDNKVVTTLSRAMREAGIPAVRFNFRGVGGSEGAYDEGRGETADALAVAAWSAERWPGCRPVFAGFSFGAYVALRLAQQIEPDRLVTVAPPVSRFDFAPLDVPRCPWLVVQGDADELVDPRAVIDWVGRLNPRPQLEVMPGTGHFFHGKLPELRAAVVSAVQGG